MWIISTWRESLIVFSTHTHAYTNRHRKCATEQPLWYESRGFLGSGMSQYTLGTELFTCLKKTTLNTVQYTQQFGEYPQFEFNYEWISPPPYLTKWQREKPVFWLHVKPVFPVQEEEREWRWSSEQGWEGKNSLTRLNWNVIIYTSFPASRFYQHFLGTGQTKPSHRHRHTQMNVINYDLDTHTHVPPPQGSVNTLHQPRCSIKEVTSALRCPLAKIRHSPA